MSETDLRPAMLSLVGREARFGPFRLIPARQLLLCGDRIVPLGARAFEVLLTLVGHAGELVGKETLISKAWPNTYVDESNLRTAIAAIRRALSGQDSVRFLATVPGRGYRFVASVTISDDVAHRRNLPASIARVIGREHAIDALVAELKAHRLVTVVGPGGVGKTTTALSAARRTVERREFSAAVVVDLAHLKDPVLVPSALRSALGVVADGDDMSAIQTHLADERLLILIDSCEPLLAAAAAEAESILTLAPRVSVLATSREPLRADGERIWRLDPLSAPPPYASCSASKALEFSAVELFCERAAASRADFELTDSIAREVCEICRRLDGLPLAIELAAGRLDVLDVSTLAAELNDYFRLHMPGRSSSLPRHRTLQATLDWSFERLTEKERVLFRRLAVFRDPFAPDAVRGVVTDALLPSVEISSILASLAAKSLIAKENNGHGRHRLLDTTRAYALQRLVDSGEVDDLRERHARYFERRLGEPAQGAGDGPAIAAARAGMRSPPIESAGFETNAPHYGDPMRVPEAARDMVDHGGTNAKWLYASLLALEQKARILDPHGDHSTSEEKVRVAIDFAEREQAGVSSQQVVPLPDPAPCIGTDSGTVA
ncbi:winged helix-turn-helix domain-containing protein [Bradyrhizobium sp. dw_78]|uniref:ATP-binding protein n=1 Tax=Bradyrhizobium sp. dw_78 TaxID=2719793 RepID=UPI001BD2B216|nr:winged helix-turn-helix domain-containing protein [Bradyrhizobium sp. dw_78]